MTTYKEIQNWVKRHCGFTPKTCWIAHVLADLGLTTRQAPNRIDKTQRRHPCPVKKRPAILDALRHFDII
jgi:hypothetical protein